MNKFNLTKLKRYGLLAEIVGVTGGEPHLRLNLPSGRATGIAAPPHPFEMDRFSAATEALSDPDRREFFEKDESCAIAARALVVLGRQGEKIAAAAKNNHLSGPGRLAIFVEATTEGVTQIAGHFAALLAIGKRLEQQHSALYAVPQPEDAGATMVDVETRRAFREMAEPMSALTKLSDRGFERLLLALKRSPMPLEGPVAQLVEDAWVQRVCDTKPEEAATLKIAEENHEWAIGTTRFIAELLEAPPLNGTNRALDRFALYTLVRGSGGAEIFAFTDEETRLFERRLAQAAA